MRQILRTYNRESTYYPIKARDPYTGKEEDFRISTETAENLIKRFPTKYYDLIHHNVSSVLLNPAIIFSGIRDHEDGGLCYTNRVRRAWSIRGEEKPSYPNKVFAVYVNPYKYVYLWRWELESPNKLGYPIGFDDKSRYKEQLWTP